MPLQPWDHFAYTQIKNKLLSKVKEEIQRNLIEQKLKEFELYEKRFNKMKEWEKAKEREIKDKQRERKQSKRLEKEMKERKKEMGERAFRDWLRRSMGKHTRIFTSFLGLEWNFD